MLKDKIKKLKIEHKISQAKLGNILNISEQAIAKWEFGKSEPDSENIVKLSEILSIQQAC